MICLSLNVCCRRLVRRAAPLFAVLLPCLASCGLKDYETLFEREAERIKKFDEADQALGNPINFPMNVGTKQQPAFIKNENIFLRLPLGFGGVTTTTNPVLGLLYRFGKDDKPPGPPARGELFPPPNDKETGIREIYVGFTLDAKPEEVRGKLEQIFRNAKGLPRKKVERVGRDPIVFDAWTWTDAYKPASMYLIYAARGDSNTIGVIVFRIPDDKAKATSINNAVQYTLQSAVFGSQAPLLNQNFRERKELAKK